MSKQSKIPIRIGLRARTRRSGTQMDVAEITRLCPELGEGINYREIGDKFGVVASRACAKVNTTGTDENLCRLPEYHFRSQCPGAQIFARAPAKGYVQTGACI